MRLPSTATRCAPNAAPRGRIAALSVWAVVLLALTSPRAALTQAADTGKLVPPKIVTYAPAAYPKALFDKQLRGQVVLQLEIGTDGAVRKATVVESAGPDFDAAALEAGQKLVFTPAMMGDKPVPVALRFRYRFQPEVAAVRRARAPSMSRYDRRGPENVPPGFSSLTGVLIERGTGRPIEGTLVLLPKLGQEAITERDGSFRFGALPAGKHQLYIPGATHKALRQQVIIADGKTTTAELRAERKSYVIYRATAEAPPQPGEMARRSLSVEEIQKIPGVYGDAFKVVQNMPGVARNLGGLLVVRGSAPQDTQMFMEGVKIPLFYHFGGLYSIFNTDILEGVDFMPGGYPLRYGRGMGGVLASRLALPKADARWNGYVESNVFHTGFLVRGPITEDTHIAVAGRRSYVDLILDAVVPEGALPFSQAPRYWDFQLKLDHRFSNRTSMTLFAFGSDDSVAALVDTPPAAFPDAHGDLETTSNFTSIIGVLRHDGQDWTSRTTLGLLVSTANFALGSAFRFDAMSEEVTVREDLTFGSGPLQLRTGFDFYWTPFQVEALLPSVAATGERGTSGGNPPGRERVFLTLDGSQVMPGVWVDAVFRLRDDLEVVPGVRLDLFRDLANGQTVTPRLNARYAWNKAVTLKGAVGTTSQVGLPPQLMDPPVGNPNLVPQQALEVALGSEYRHSEVVDFDVQVFYKRIWDLVVTETAGPFTAVPYSSDGTGRIYGLELLARHKLASNFFGWIAYTLQRAERVDHPGEPARLFGWDQTHILTALGSYKLPDNWEVGARWRLTSGNPYTPLATTVWNEQTDSYTRVPSTDKNSARVPPFHQLDVRVDKKWIFDSWMFSAYLDVQNVYNRYNPSSVNYNFDASEQAWFVGLPIIPSIGVKGEF